MHPVAWSLVTHESFSIKSLVIELFQRERERFSEKGHMYGRDFLGIAFFELVFSVFPCLQKKSSY